MIQANAVELLPKELASRGFVTSQRPPYYAFEWDLLVTDGAILKVGQDGDEVFLNIENVDDGDWVGLSESDDLAALLPLIDRLISAFLPLPGGTVPPALFPRLAQL